MTPIAHIPHTNHPKTEDKPSHFFKLKKELANTDSMVSKKKMNVTTRAPLYNSKPALVVPQEGSADRQSLSIGSSQNVPMSLAQSNSTRVTKIVTANKFQESSIEESRMQLMRRLNKEKIDRMMNSYMIQDKPKSKPLLKTRKTKIQLPELPKKDVTKRDMLSQEYLVMPVEIAQRPSLSRGDS